MQLITAFSFSFVICRSLFELDLMKVNPERGFYRIMVSAGSQQPSDVKLIGTTGAEVNEEYFRLKSSVLGYLC
jgi:hypothetical protein